MGAVDVADVGAVEGVGFQDVGEGDLGCGGRIAVEDAQVGEDGWNIACNGVQPGGFLRFGALFGREIIQTVLELLSTGRGRRCMRRRRARGRYQLPWAIQGHEQLE